MGDSSSNTSAPADSTLSTEFLTTEILIGIAAGIGVILLILLIVIVWLCCRNSRNNIKHKKDAEADCAVGNGSSTDANENIPGERSKLLEQQQQPSTTAINSSSENGGVASSLAPSTPTSDSNLESMLGKQRSGGSFRHVCSIQYICDKA